MEEKQKGSAKGAYAPFADLLLLLTPEFGKATSARSKPVVLCCFTYDHFAKAMCPTHRSRQVLFKVDSNGWDVTCSQGLEGRILYSPINWWRQVRQAIQALKVPRLTLHPVWLLQFWVFRACGWGVALSCVPACNAKGLNRGWSSTVIRVRGGCLQELYSSAATLWNNPFPA